MQNRLMGQNGIFGVSSVLWLFLITPFVFMSCASGTKTDEKSSSHPDKLASILESEDLKDKSSSADDQTLSDESGKESKDSVEDVSLSQEASKALETIISKAEEEVEKKTSAQAPTNPSADDPELFPTEINESVKKWIEYFSVRDRERFQRFLDRGERYRSVVQTILKENDVPADLYYLAMIESGYSTHAKSSASAVGVWQFIKGTGKRYDLEVSHYVDERRDPIRATEAAAKYLTDLYNAFQSWYLAMAAYNAGEFRILNSIIAGKSRDYWTLVRKKMIPRETRDYVPKFLAAAIIGRHPEKYGFKINQDDEFPSVEAVSLPSPVRLADISQQADVPLEALKAANPHLLRGITSPTHAYYEVWVPKERVKKVESSIPALASAKLKGIRVAQAVRPSEDQIRSVYKVKRGDTLAAIARKHHVSVSYLKRLNDLSRSHIFVGQPLRVAARGYSNAKGNQASRNTAQQAVKLSQSSPQRVAPYRVRRGDSLAKIADRHGVTINHLKKVNRLASGRIYVGQKLRIN